MNTYPEMNEKIVAILRLADEENVVAFYAATRIEELEHEVGRLRAGLEEIAAQASLRNQRVVEGIARRTLAGEE